MLAVHPSMLWAPEHPRALVLAALADVLPEAVLRRGTKSDLQAAFARDLIRSLLVGMRDLDRWMLVRDGYAEPSSLREIFERFIEGSLTTGALVRSLLRAEALLRRVHAPVSYAATAASR